MEKAYFITKTVLFNFNSRGLADHYFAFSFLLITSLVSRIGSGVEPSKS